MKGPSQAALMAPAWTAAALLAAAAAISARPLLPVDETRYLSVAWEMWRDGHILVPYLDGVPYSHKPPLLFWLIELGWAAFGVSEWWPRMISPLLGVAGLGLVAGLARGLWPDRPRAAAAAPWMLLAIPLWALFSSLVMFDLLLAVCALIALVGLVRAWRRGGALGFVLFGAGIGLGILAKGPAILIHVLPAAVLAPLWGPSLAASDCAGPRPQRGWRWWIVGTLGGLALGAAIALAWAVPAAIAGGGDYARAIFWGQSAGRMVSSFAHARPWWSYLALMPALALPWTLWPPLWRAAWAAGRAALADGGARLCLIWLVAAVIEFSAISGKQPQYLLPELPALALLFAFWLFAGTDAPWLRRWDEWPLAAVLAVIGLALAAVPLAGLIAVLPPWAHPIAPGWALGAAAAGAALAWRPWPSPVARVVAIAAALTLALSAAQLAVQPALEKTFDLKPLAERLGTWERAGYALANVGKYRGQYGFLGRLQRPVAVVGVRAGDLQGWLDAHSKGKVIAYQKRIPSAAKPDAEQRFRGRFITVWDAAVVRAHPAIVRRND